jgi:hypothetical protein
MWTVEPLAATDLPHHPGPVLRVLELLDQRGDVLLVALRHEGVDDRLLQVEVLDPLRGEVGLELVGWDSPHLLGVALEEVLEEPAPESRDDPPLELVLVLRRADLGPHVRQHDPHRLDRAHVLEDVHGAERVVVELAAVVDAAHPRTEEEVVVGQDLVPQRLDLGHLGEEAVAADVEPPAVTFDGAADAADLIGSFQHRRRDPFLVQLEGGGEPGRTGPDDDDLMRRHEGPIVPTGSPLAVMPGTVDPPLRIATCGRSSSSPRTRRRRTSSACCAR